jgi:adenylate cyclase
MAISLIRLFQRFPQRLLFVKAALPETRAYFVKTIPSDSAQRLKAQLRVATASILIVAHGGRIVGTAGDSVLADFSSVVDALNCAVAMQRTSRAVNDPIPSDRRLELRIGINLGDVIVDGGDIFGEALTSPCGSRGSRDPGRYASRRPCTTRSETSSISITARLAAIASRI